MATELVICGYCETQNEFDNQSCLACGAPLDDEITKCRNNDTIESLRIFAPDPLYPHGFIQVKNVKTPGLTAKQWMEDFITK